MMNILVMSNDDGDEGKEKKSWRRGLTESW